LTTFQTERAKKAEQAAVEGDEDEDEDEDIEEELGYISPLDTVDPYLAFKRALTSKCAQLRTIFASSPHRSSPNEEPRRLPGFHE
jgi:hypothetical protein